MEILNLFIVILAAIATLFREEIREILSRFKEQIWFFTESLPQGLATLAVFYVFFFLLTSFL
ncbi:hypothetical protein [Helicobacter sp. MIT 05-5294]|uniref:hypothetical protein n=1 Tax=Helicobacter sp. MIT 05-5294 TaxID=1548150 RepID=UPI00051FD756|nr:hypothetical protein [Helicobacter sp. MIT 05-5294]TLD83665.1 hypothetical protein LS69_010075 [Helicobacter sp. MIT 05-5294]